MTVNFWYHSGNDIEREGNDSIGDGIAVCVPSRAQLAMTLVATVLNIVISTIYYRGLQTS